MSNEIKNGVINSLVIDGHTYQNIVPENPTLRNSVYHKYMQRFNYGYDNVIVKEDELKYAFMYGDTLINIGSERKDSYIGNTVKQRQTQKISQEFDTVYILDGLSYNAVIKGETIKYVLPKSKCFKVEGKDEITHYSVQVQATEDNQVLSYTNNLNGSFNKGIEYTLFVPYIGETERYIKLEAENGELEIIENNKEYIHFQFIDVSAETVLNLTQEFSFVNKAKDMIVPFIAQDVIVVEGNYFNIPLQILDGGLHSLSLKDLTIKTVSRNIFNKRAVVMGYVDKDGRIDDEGDPFTGEDEAHKYMRSEFIQVIPNETYNFSIDSDITNTFYRPVWSWFDKNRNLIKQDRSIDVEQILVATAPENAEFVIIHVMINNNTADIVLSDHILNAQLIAQSAVDKDAEGNVIYTPYIENTIYFSETDIKDENGNIIGELELRSIGDVYDELDLNRSVIIRRIKEVEVDGERVLRRVIDEYEEPVKISSTGNIVKIDIKKFVDDSSWDIEKLEDGFQLRLKALKGTILDNLVEGYFEIESNDEEVFYKDNIVLNEEKNGIVYALSVKVPKGSRIHTIFTQDNIDDMELYYIKWMEHVLPELDVVIWCESETRYVSNVNELLSFEDGYLMFNPIRRHITYKTELVPIPETDKEGNIIYDEDQCIVYKKFPIYDEDGKLLYERVYVRNDKDEIEYDSKGNAKYEQVEERDENGTVVYTDKLVVSYEKVIAKDKDGNILYEKNGDIKYNRVQKIDKDGNLLNKYDYEYVYQCKDEIINVDNCENTGCSPTIPNMEIEMPADNAFYLNMLRPNIYYTLSNHAEANYVIIDGQVIDIIDNTFKTPEEIEVKMVIVEKKNKNSDLSNIMIVEGDHAGKTIPFFEGSLNVTNPKVSILGRNLYNPDSNGFIKVQPGENYIKYYKDGDSFKISGANVSFYADKDESTILPNIATAYNFYVPKDALYIKFDAKGQKIQLEQCLIENFAEYVDPNTGIISGIELPEIEDYTETKLDLDDFTLRSVGEIRDIYDLQNGAFVKNVVEVEFNGTTDNGWKEVSEDKYSKLFSLEADVLEGRITNDKYAYGDLQEESCIFYKDGKIFVRVLLEDMEKLSEEKVTIYYAVTPVNSEVKKTAIASKNGGSLSIDIDGSLLPLINYEVATENSFHIDAFQNGENVSDTTEYTLRWDNGDKAGSMTFTLDGEDPYNISYDGVIAITNTISKIMVVENIAGRKPMLVLGNVKGVEFPYFTGIRTASDNVNDLRLEITNVLNNDGSINVGYMTKDGSNISLSSLPNGEREQIVVNVLDQLAMYKRKVYQYTIDENTSVKEIKPAEIHGYTQVVIPFPSGKKGINNLYCDKLDTRYFFNEYVFIDENGINFILDNSFVWDINTFRNYLKYRPESSFVILYELEEHVTTDLTLIETYEIPVVNDVPILSSINENAAFPYNGLSHNQTNSPAKAEVTDTPLVHVLQDNEELQTNAIVKPVLSLRGKKYKVRVKPDTEYTVSFKLSEATGVLEFDLAGNKFNYNVDDPKPVVIKTPEKLAHNYLYIKGGKCKISEVMVVEDHVTDKYFETVNSVGLFEDNILKITSDEGDISIQLPTDLRSVGSEEDVYLPDKGLVRQYITKKVLSDASQFVDKGIEGNCRVYHLENIDAKASDVIFHGKLLPELEESCTIEGNSLVIRFSVYRKESFKDFLSSNNVTVFYAVITPEEFNIDKQDLEFEQTENFSSTNDIPPVFTFRTNAFFNVNLVPDKEYTISCICPEDAVALLTANSEKPVDMEKDDNSNLHTLTLTGEQIGTSFDFETESAELRNIMVVEKDSDQPYSTNMISGITPFDIIIGSLNLVDIDTADITHSEALNVSKEEKVIYIENNDCIEETTNIKIPITDEFNPLEGYYVASVKVNDLAYSDTNRINHRFTLKMVDMYGDIVGISTKYLLDEEGILLSDPYLVTKGNFIKGIAIEDEMSLSNEAVSMVNTLAYNISEVVVRYFGSLEEAEAYKHEFIDFVAYNKVSIDFAEPLYSLSDLVYDSIDYKNQLVTRNIGVCKLTADKATSITYDEGQKLYTMIFRGVVMDAQPNSDYVFSSLPLGDADSKFSCAYFDYITGNVTVKLYQDVTADYDAWLKEPGLEMLYQLDNAVIKTFAELNMERPVISIPVNAGITTEGSKARPELDWRSEQIDVNISSVNVYTVIFDMINGQVETGNVFIGPNVTRDIIPVIGVNRVAVRVDPNTINDCTYVELDFPSARIGKVMVVPGNFEDTDNGDQLHNVLFEESLFESVADREPYNAISISADSGSEYVLERLPHPLRGLPNHVQDEILFENSVGHLVTRVGIFELIQNSSIDINENAEKDVYEIVIKDLRIADTDNIGMAVMCNCLPVIDKAFNPLGECITNADTENKLQIQIPFTVFNTYTGTTNRAKALDYISKKAIVLVFQLPEESKGGELVFENSLVLRDGFTTIQGLNHIPPYIRYMGIDYTFDKNILKVDQPYTIIFNADSNDSKVDNITVSLCDETELVELLEGVNNYKVVITPEYVGDPTLVLSAKDAIFSDIMVFEGDYSEDKHTPTEFIIGKQSVGVETTAGSGKYRVQLRANEESELAFIIDSPLRRVDDVFDSIDFDLLTGKYYHIKRISEDEEILEKPVYTALDVEEHHLLLDNGNANVIESTEAVKAPFILSPLEYHLNVKPSTKYELLFIGDINSSALKVRFNGVTIKTIRGTSQPEMYRIPFTTDSLATGARLTFEKVTELDNMVLDKVQYVRVFEVTTASQIDAVKEAPTVRINGIQSAGESGEITLVSTDTNLFDIRALDEAQLPKVEYIIKDSGVIRTKPLGAYDVFSLVDDPYMPKGENGCVSKLPHILPNTDYTLSFDLHSVSGSGVIGDISVVGYIADNIDETDIHGYKIASSKSIPISTETTNFSCTFNSEFEVHGVGFTITMDGNTEELVLNINKIQLERGESATRYESCNKFVQSILLTDPLRSLPNGKCDIISEGSIVRRTAMTQFTGTDWTIEHTEDGYTTVYAYVDIYKNPTPLPSVDNDNIICNFPITYDFAPGIVAKVQLEKESNEKFRLTAVYNGILDITLVQGVLDRYPVILIYEIDEEVLRNKAFMYPDVVPYMEQHPVTGGQLTFTVYDAVRPYLTAGIPVDTNAIVEDYKQEVKELKEEVGNLRDLNEMIMNEYKEHVVKQTAPLYNTINVLINHSVFYNYAEDGDGEQLFIKLFGPFFVQQIKSGVSTLDQIVEIYDFDPLTQYLLDQLGIEN